MLKGKPQLLALCAITFVSAALCGSSSILAQDPERGSGEGIKVHGHWVIEVRNPDGRLAARHEFENALESTGGSALANFIGRQNVPGLWQIVLNGNPNPCIDPSNAPHPCYIIEPFQTMTPSDIGAFFQSLSFSVNAAGQLVLRGSATARGASTLTQVSTTVQGCPAASSLGSCPGGFNNFTGKSLPTSGTGVISVVAGQIIQVTVTISFS